MLPDDSIADTVASHNFKWTRDSWISQNHPTVDNSADRSTFYRGQLDTAKKEEVQKMARFLDDYRSPERRRIAEHYMDQNTILPQAASSPKSESHLLQSVRRRGPSTPSMTHRSMSPTPTSTSISWQKHTMRQHSGGEHSLPINDSERQSLERAEALEKINLTKSASTKNYKPTQISPAEDSYWRTNERQQKIQHPEITPSPIKQREQFFTAKQSPISADISRTVDSLRIGSASVQSSPSLRKPANMSKEQLHDFFASKAEQEAPSVYTILSERDQTRTRTTANLARRSASENGSQLSKVDSQATSLQRAITNALQDDGPTTNIEDGLNLTLEETIAARYRQSLAESHIDKDVENATSLSCTSVGVQTNLATHLEREAKTTPGVTEQADHIQDRDASIASRSRLAESEHPRMQEMLLTLQAVTEECSRRGRLIDDMAEQLLQVNPEAENTIEIAAQQARFLEGQLSQYKTQVDEMSKELKSLLQAQGVAHSSGPAESICSKTAVREETRYAFLSMSQNGPQEDIAHTNEEKEESFIDKVQRWDKDIEVSLHDLGTQASIDEAVARAHMILDREAPSIHKINARTVHRTSFANHLSPSSITKEILTPRAAQVATSTPLSKGSLPQPLSHRVPEGTSQTFESGPATDTHDSQRYRNLDRKESTIRPLTAAMMSDAKDIMKSAEHKIYNRLQLGKVDEMHEVELGNMLKNILIQLDIPYDKIPKRVTELGANLANTGKAENLLWHEALKLREFAEQVHSILYAGHQIEGTTTSAKCLRDMQYRVKRMHRALERGRTEI